MYSLGDCAATIVPIVRALLGLVEAGAIDEVVVVDAGGSRERLRVRIRPERVQQARRALDVGEEEREGPGG